MGVSEKGFKIIKLYAVTKGSNSLRFDQSSKYVLNRHYETLSNVNTRHGMLTVNFFDANVNLV